MKVGICCASSLKAVAKSELDGIVFTFAMDFDNAQWIDYIESLVELFENNGGTVYFVELETDLAERLVRNKSENRLLHKPPKRNIEQTDISAKDAAKMIKEKFALCMIEVVGYAEGIVS